MKRQPLDDSFKVNRNPVTLREIVLERMRGAILSGRFKSGERLVERTLCDQLGVSRSVVREVIRILEAEGLVESAGGRGPRVARLDWAQARQIYDIRLLLEGQAAAAFLAEYIELPGHDPLLRHYAQGALARVGGQHGKAAQMLGQLDPAHGHGEPHGEHTQIEPPAR